MHRDAEQAAWPRLAHTVHQEVRATSEASCWELPCIVTFLLPLDILEGDCSGPESRQKVPPRNICLFEENPQGKKNAEPKGAIC